MCPLRHWRRWRRRRDGGGGGVAAVAAGLFPRRSRCPLRHWRLQRKPGSFMSPLSPLLVAE